MSKYELNSDLRNGADDYKRGDSVTSDKLGKETFDQLLEQGVIVEVKSRHNETEDDTTLADAQAEAKRIVKEAEDQAARTRGEADTYAEETRAKADADAAEARETTPPSSQVKTGIQPQQGPAAGVKAGQSK